MERRRLLLWGIVALAVIVALVAWLATRGDGGSPGTVSTLSASELRDAASSSEYPIFWVGPMAGAEFELVEPEGGGTQVLYVPEGTESEGATAGALTIGSYPLADPAKALKAFAARPGAIVRHADDGREVVSSRKSPTNVYFASPDDSVQVEVYAPSPGRAMRLALSGRVRPVP